ncbi:MAG: protein kinase [Chloroflexi bacterium]|nr:protein kinase [Chloroflexota bacterium]
MRLAGKTIGNYKVIDVLGAGGMATVYRARQTNIERDVAIKVMAAAFAQQPDFVERFKREAELFAQLEHPHILPIYDYGDEDGYLYLVLRLMEGGSLESHMRKQALTLAQISKMITQMAHALDHAHNQNVIHRDIKPNNVLLDKFGNAYLMDFGIAKILSNSRLTATGTLLGTPAYMAPEQWKLDPIDGRADIYSIGVMLYELFTGELPFPGETPFQFMYAHLHEEVPAVSTKLEGFSPEIDEVILRATAKEPEDRYQTADEMAGALDEAIRNADSSRPIEVGGSKKKSEQIGKILVALERSDSGLYAIPKLEDFVKKSYSQTTVEQRKSKMDDIFDTIENKPPTQAFDISQMKDMLSQGKINQAFLGVSAQPVSLPPNLKDTLGQDTGLLIIGVDPNSPAESGGLHIGDILVTIDGKTLQHQDDLKDILQDEHIGQPIEVSIVRAGQHRTFDIIPQKKAT